MAIALNLIPYYGKPKDSEKPYIYRSKAKDGTCSFYVIGNALVLRLATGWKTYVELELLVKSLV